MRISSKPRELHERFPPPALEPTCEDIARCLASIGARPSSQQPNAIAYLVGYLGDCGAQPMSVEKLVIALRSESRFAARVYQNKPAVSGGPFCGGIFSQ